MQVSISVRHGQLAEATQEKLKSKVEKLSRFFDRLMAIELVVDLQNEQAPAVEIMVSAEHKHDFVATVKSAGKSAGKSENLLTATDAASQKIEQQLRKYKEKLQQKHRSSQPRRSDVGPGDVGPGGGGTGDVGPGEVESETREEVSE